MSDEAPATNPAAPAAEPTPPVPTPPAPAAEPAAPSEPNADPAGENIDELPEWARKSLTKANKEAASYRDAAKKAKEEAETAQRNLVQNIGKALGLVKDDEAPTVESLTEALRDKDSNLTTAQAAQTALRAENAVLRFAGKHKGDADALLDSRDFEKKLAAIDSTADNYASQVEDLVKSEIDTNARYRKVQVATSNSNGLNIPTGDPAPAEPDTSFEGLAKRRAERRKNRL
ncbi:hypothetical protein PTQ19_10360 [Microbacterium esteraromaticum]|uniref:hypothetical protein n=1 Tax=Microbacterium esteraromaticum TaxID=57043 RepID=UPI0023678ABD|nr:hypothetical protein [Microbacterium esteraromaticum]WDH77924.1 hypothetical protein PTQ19_10360 [Microbacterium esteraromaticum]